MAASAQSLPQKQTLWDWSLVFLRDELRFYPGRAGKIARITISCIVTFILLETFRVPGVVFGVISVFLVSRDTPENSIRTTIDSVLATFTGVSIVLVGATVFADSKFIHFFFLIAAFFLLFFMIRTFVNPIVVPNLAVGFYAASIIWDGISSPQAQVEACLWILLSICLGLIVACFVELIFVRQGPFEQLLRDIDQRIHAAAEVFLNFSEQRGEAPKRTALDKIASLAVVGTGRLRREMQVITRNHSYSLAYYASVSTVIALTGRLVDVSATLDAVTTQPSEKDNLRLRALFDDCERIRVSLLRGEPLESRSVPYTYEYSAGVPALPVLERTLSLFPVAFQNAPTPGAATVPSFDSVSKSRIFVNDAFTNPEYLQFAVKGMMAAMICYIIYSAVDWPGISTAVFSCLITALSTIGASKQKQFMRLSGAFVGGALGIASLVFILPSIDSITGISLLLAAGTAFSAWFWTASPRISYFGIQVALGFYLTLLQGFGEGTSLEPPRDRLVGVLLSIIVMGFVFDTLWPTLASSKIRVEFAKNLRSMAKFSSLLADKDRAAAGLKIASLRETINTSFANVHTDADSIKFESGPEVEADRALRDSILRWQSGARSLYLLELSLGRQLAIQSELHTVTPELDAAYKDFCDTTGEALEALASRVDRKDLVAPPDVKVSLSHLEKELSSWFQLHTGEDTAQHVSAILATARQIAAMIEVGESEIPAGPVAVQPT